MKGKRYQDVIKQNHTCKAKQKDMCPKTKGTKSNNNKRDLTHKS